ncbi:Two pore calcium channel protein 1 [Trichoplax sp. H2]|nr:Two pore calcium channel protein 1 [Trichoplax sp. H2]|eukprot:RDD44376.1 Two pore calcium channel protein 1 [Trichoplax sp. H2]
MDKVSKSLSRALGGESAFKREGKAAAKEGFLFFFNEVFEINQRPNTMLHIDMKKITLISSSNEQLLIALNRDERDLFYTLTDEDFEETNDDNLKWRYKEAAIYINEGASGANFDRHPATPKAINAYMLVHNTWLRLADLLVCIIILVMAFFERPSVNPDYNNNRTRIIITASIELVCYIFLLIGGWIRYRLIGWKGIFKEKRSMMYVFIFLSLIDAMLVLVLPYQFYRFSRPFRPIYIINNHYSSGTRRVILDILRSASEIIDVFMMTITFIFVFSLLGFYLFFNPQPGQYVQLDQDWYFRELGISFVSFFICLTTANFPDAMLPAYKTIGHSATIYFIIFCLIGIYFLQNLFLAAIYSSFNENSKYQFKKILLGTRKGLRLAFNLIDSDQIGRISFRDFRGIMKYYSSSTPLRDLVLMFKIMDEDGEGTITLDEFYEFLSVCAITWDSDETHDQFFIFDYDSLPECLKPVAKGMYWFVTWIYFQWIVNLVIIANTIWLLAKAITADQMVATQGGLKAKEYLEVLHPIDYIFVGFYVIEILTRMIGIGWNRFVSSISNLIDMLIIIAAVAGALLSTGRVGNPLSYLAFLRLFLILRFIDIRLKLTIAMETIGMILPRMLSFVLVVTYMYYFFAIIGMEAFPYKNSKCGCTMVHHYSNITTHPLNNSKIIAPYGDYTYGCSDDQFYNIAGNTTVLFRNVNNTLEVCAKKTTDQCVKDNGLDCDCSIKSCGGHYSSSYDRTSPDGLYYLMNFDSILNAYTTLFALMVVNNWQIIMFGTIDASGTTWSIAYFIFFYFIAVEVIVNVVQAFILDAFNKMTPHVEAHLKLRDKGKNSSQIDVIQIPILKSERKSIIEAQNRKWYSILSAGYIYGEDTEVSYNGRRSLNTLDIFLIVYEEDLNAWLSEEDGLKLSRSNEPTIQFRPGKDREDDYSGNDIELIHTSPVTKDSDKSTEIESLKAEIKQLRIELASSKRPSSDRSRSPNSTLRRSQIDIVSANPDNASRMSAEYGPHPPPRRASKQDSKLQDLV